MFNEKRTLLFLTQEARVSFMGKRQAFEGAPKPEVLAGAAVVPEVKEKPATPEEQEEVRKYLTGNEIKTVWDKNQTFDKNITKLAKDLYPDKEARQKYVLALFNEIFNPMDKKEAEEKLKKNGCQSIYLKDGEPKFYKVGKDGPFTPENEITLPTTAVKISPTKKVEGGTGAVASVASEEKKGPEEAGADKKSALGFFKKAFPHAKPDQIRVSTMESVAVDSKAKFNIKSYANTVTDPDMYNEDGGTSMFYKDKLRTEDIIPATFKKGFIIEAPKRNGAIAKFVYVGLDIDPYIGKPFTQNGWVELGNLSQGPNKVKTENAWDKAEVTDESLEAKEYSVLGNTSLYYGEAKKALPGGTILRSIESGDKVNVIAGEKVIRVGGEDFVKVTYNKNGGVDRGWIRKSVLVKPAAGPKAASEVAYNKETDTRADEEMVKKYYDRETGRVHFDGDAKAEQIITISDLFPGAKEGDKITVRHGTGGKTMEATYNPTKEYTKVVAGKSKKRTGTFVYGNGARVEIYNGDFIKPQWAKAPEKAPDDRSFLEKRNINEGETFEVLAKEALDKYPAITEVMAKGSADKTVQIERYAKLLKKLKAQYEWTNVVYYVVPTLMEAGAPSEAETMDATMTARAERHGIDSEAKRKAAETEFRGGMDKYRNKKEKIKIHQSLIDIVNDEDEWKRAWNGEGTKEIAGLDRLIQVLKLEAFQEAGINEQNAREKILGLIQEYSNKEVDLMDVINYMGIYRKIDPLTGQATQVQSFGDFESDFKKFNETLKKDQAGFDAFNVKAKEVLPNLDIIKLVTEKKNQALAQGYENPYALVTPNQRKAYVKAQADMETVYADPNYKAWDEYRMNRMYLNHLNNVLYAGGKLLDAIGKLSTVEFQAATPETMPADTQKCVDMMGTVFGDAKTDEWYKKNTGGRRFAWEDVVAGEGAELDEEGDPDGKKAMGQFGHYFDGNAPMLRIRSRLNKYTDDKGALDGTERISETDTVNEFNRLIEKALKRLIVWKKNPTAVAEFLNTYSDTKIDLPAKNAGETDEAYATRVAPMVTAASKGAFEKLKLTNFGDLQFNPNSGELFKQMVRDRMDLIKMGYYFDSRDEEKGLVEAKEGSLESRLSMNPFTRKVQEAAIAAGYPAENVKKIESIFIGGAAIKVDTTKKGAAMLGGGIGTGIPLGDGYTGMISVGADSSGPVIGVGIRKEWDLGKDFKAGATGGMGVGATGPSVSGGLAFTFPVSSDVDLSVFAGGSVGLLVAGAGGGIGISKNYERAHRELEKQIGGFDPKEIDEEKDQHVKYTKIINNPAIGPFYRSAAENFPTEAAREQVVLELYAEQRKRISAGAAVQNSNPVISGGGVFAGVVMIAGEPVPYVGPYIEITIDKTVLVYRRQSESSKAMEQVSEAEVMAALAEEVKKKNPGKDVVTKTTMAGQSGDVMVDAQGNISIRKKNSAVDLTGLADKPNMEKYNEALKPFDMKLVPDAATGLWEFQVFGALGNLQMLMDPGMENRGLILKDGKVFLAPGAKPELFITREEFYTPFPKQGSPMNTIITISDTPKRSRSKIRSGLVDNNGAYLYRKAGMEWMVMPPEATGGNTMNFAQYQQHKEQFQTSAEGTGGEGYNKEQFAAYQKKVEGMPFMKDVTEDELSRKNEDKLSDFSKKFLPKNVAKFREYTTVTPQDTQETIAIKRQKFAALIQDEAKKGPPAGYGPGKELTDIQVNYVMSQLMDLSFSELDKAGDKAARFEQNLEWSKKAVLLPFFKQKIEELSKRVPPVKINSTAEELVEFFAARLLMRVRPILQAAKPGEKIEGEKIGDNWVFSSVAGAIGTGMRGVPGYMQKDYGVLGMNYDDITKPGKEGDLAKIILEMESPVNEANDKTFMESIMAKKMLSMPGLWFMLGDASANQALEGAREALSGQPVSAANKAGFEKFKALVKAIRETELRGGNAYIYNDPDSKRSFEFRLNTKVADAAHERCGNASFGVSEDIQIFVRVPGGGGMVAAAGKESVATVSPEVTASFLTLGFAGVVTIKTGGGGEEGGGGGGTTTTTTNESGGSEGGGSGDATGSNGGANGGNTGKTTF